jgi:hypothetical protein
VSSRNRDFFDDLSTSEWGDDVLVLGSAFCSLPSAFCLVSGRTLKPEVDTTSASLSTMLRLWELLSKKYHSH